jgi:hypothetical protein
LCCTIQYRYFILVICCFLLYQVVFYCILSCWILIYSDFCVSWPGCTTVFYNDIFCYIMLLCASSCVFSCLHLYLAIIICSAVSAIAFCFVLYPAVSAISRCFLIYPAVSAIFYCYLFYSVVSAADFCYILLFLLYPAFLLYIIISCFFCYILLFLLHDAAFFLYPPELGIFCYTLLSSTISYTLFCCAVVSYIRLLPAGFFNILHFLLYSPLFPKYPAVFWFIQMFSATFCWLSSQPNVFYSILFVIP